MSDLPLNRMTHPKSYFEGPALLTVLDCLVLFRTEIHNFFFMAHAVCFILEIFGWDYRWCSVTPNIVLNIH